MSRVRMKPVLDLATLARGDKPEGLLAGFSLRELSKGQLFSSPGNERDEVFVVRSGRLRVYLSGENRDLSLSFLECGDIFTTHTPTYIEAVTEASLWTMPTRGFAQRLASDPSATPEMMRVLGRLLSDAIQLIEDLAFREVPARLARFLLGLADRRGQLHPSGWLIPLDLGMEDIASLLGTTRQSVSSLINQWEREGILQRQGRRTLLLQDRERLAHYLPQEG